LIWYDPRAGAWGASVELKSDSQGVVALPAFPNGGDVAGSDWAAKITELAADASKLQESRERPGSPQWPGDGVLGEEGLMAGGESR